MASPDLTQAATLGNSAVVARKGGKGKWVVVIVLVVLAAGGATYLATRSKSETSAVKPGGKPEVKAVIHLEGFLVNLADDQENRFLRLGIDLGLEKEISSGEGNAVSTPLIRDTILGVLTTWQSSALLAPNGKAKLKEQLLRDLKQKAPELGVTDIYFTDFLVQL